MAALGSLENRRIDLIVHDITTFFNLTDAFSPPYKRPRRLLDGLPDPLTVRHRLAGMA